MVTGYQFDGDLKAGFIHPLPVSLWFGGKAGSNQGFVTAQCSFNLLVTIFQHDERRTGARVFSRSGAIGDVPSFFIKAVNPGFDFSEGHTETFHCVAGFILRC